MTELLILDLVLLVGIAVVPRFVRRSFLATRRTAKECLREATAREPVTAVAAARAGLGRAARSVRPAAVVTPLAIALAVLAGYAAWSNPDPSQSARTDGLAADVPTEPAGESSPLHAGRPDGELIHDDLRVDAPSMGHAAIDCKATAELREAVLRIRLL